jgi:hypothetical protein
MMAVDVSQNMFILFGPKNQLRHLRHGRRKAPPLYTEVKRRSPSEASYNCQSKGQDGEDPLKTLDE